MEIHSKVNIMMNRPTTYGLRTNMLWQFPSYGGFYPQIKCNYYKLAPTLNKKFHNIEQIKTFQTFNI